MAEQPVKRAVPGLLRVGIVVAGLASLGALAALIGIAVLKVRGGNGLETYRTFWLVENNWMGFLIFVAVALVAVFVGLLFRLKERREIQKLERKYGDKTNV